MHSRAESADDRRVRGCRESPWRLAVSRLPAFVLPADRRPARRAHPLGTAAAAHRLPSTGAGAPAARVPDHGAPCLRGPRVAGLIVCRQGQGTFVAGEIETASRRQALARRRRSSRTPSRGRGSSGCAAKRCVRWCSGARAAATWSSQGRERTGAWKRLTWWRFAGWPCDAARSAWRSRPSGWPRARWWGWWVPTARGRRRCSRRSRDFGPSTKASCASSGSTPGRSRSRCAGLGFMSDELPLFEMRVDRLLHMLSGYYPSWDGELVARLVDRFEIDLRQKVSALSHGQGTRLRLVTAMAFRPASSCSTSGRRPRPVWPPAPARDRPRDRPRRGAERPRQLAPAERPGAACRPVARARPGARGSAGRDGGPGRRGPDPRGSGRGLGGGMSRLPAASRASGPEISARGCATS